MANNPNLIPGVTEPGDTIQYTNAGAEISSRAVVVVGDIAAVALTDIATGATGTLAIAGIYALAGTGTINQGDVVGVAATGDPVSTAGATKVGFAARDKDVSGDVAVVVCQGL